jgi:hypothetical protein
VRCRLDWVFDVRLSLTSSAKADIAGAELGQQQTWIIVPPKLPTIFGDQIKIGGAQPRITRMAAVSFVPILHDFDRRQLYFKAAPA